jgi:hypothetical protein
VMLNTASSITFSALASLALSLIACLQ